MDAVMEGVIPDEEFDQNPLDAAPEEPVLDSYIGETESAEPTEAVEVVDPDPVEPEPADISFNLAVIFVLSMIVGLLVFGSLSRRWHT